MSDASETSVRIDGQEFGPDEWNPEMTFAASVAVDAILEAREDAAALLAPVLAYVSAVARAAGQHDAGEALTDEMIRSPEHEAESPSSDGADEALINAMGSAWILERLCGIDAGGLDGDRALDLVTLWEAVGDTFCAEYCAGWDAA